MHAWFKPFVLTWFELAYQKARHRIDRALELDHVIIAYLTYHAHLSPEIDFRRL